VKQANRRVEVFWVALPVVFYLLAVGGAAILRHLSFHSTAYELGIYDQVVWSISRGEGPFSTLPAKNNPSYYFGHHLQPILFLLAPLYWVVSSPLTLVVCQTAFLAFGGILVYWLAREVLKDRLLAFLFLVLYLLYPPLKEMNLFDFHPIALSVPLLLGAFCFLHKDRLFPFLLFLTLALLTKEEMPGIVVIFGVYLLLVKRRPLWGAGLMLAGVTLFFLELRILMPYFSGKGVAYAVFDRYAHLGGGISGILRTLFTDPGRIFALLAAHLSYTHTIFFPLGFLPLLSPTHLSHGHVPVSLLLSLAVAVEDEVPWLHFVDPPEDCVRSGNILIGEVFTQGVEVNLAGHRRMAEQPFEF